MRKVEWKAWKEMLQDQVDDEEEEEEKRDGVIKQKEGKVD